MANNYFQERKDVIINLFITSRCNANCRECVNQTITLNSGLDSKILESDVDRDTALIKTILKKHKNLPTTVCFYGGEPLLLPQKIVQIIQRLSDNGSDNRLRYMIYTNGENIANFFKNYPPVARKIWIYAVSIDGDEVQHNKFRLGTDFKRIKKNLQFIKERYRGNILMWSTLREEQSLLNCFKEFVRLYQKGLVNHFFWHWLETPEEFKDFPRYFESYTDEFGVIVDSYIKYLKKGELLPIAHLNELVLYLITKKERGHTACGAELPTNYDLIGGKVLACVDLPFKQGKDLKKNSKKLLRFKKELGCNQCEIHFYCGGRCPVQVFCGAQKRTKQYCDLLRAHVQIVQLRLEEIKNALKEKNLTLQEIYDRSAFIVRYTDVTP
ncbi:MAG: radical SAM protein [candidate division WOR-3 bacterium]